MKKETKKKDPFHKNKRTMDFILKIRNLLIYNGLKKISYFENKIGSTEISFIEKKPFISNSK